MSQVQIQLTPVAATPWISTAMARDRTGQAWLYFACRCGDRSKKPCANPMDRASHWLREYIKMHWSCRPPTR